MSQQTDPSTADAGQHVLTHVTNRIGFIELERPQALNALSTSMVRAMQAALDAWRDDPEVLAVLVYTRHPRAFCAGGDIRFLYESYRAGDQAGIDTFFIEEYRLNHTIFSYPKPYIALMNGVVMGGGMGISQGAHRTGGLRVVDGTTRMAMPETRIGLFPDVGMGWFLARTPGALGRYLAVTGETLDAASALYAGLADVAIDSSVDGNAHAALLDALQTEPFMAGDDIVKCIRRAPQSEALGRESAEVAACALAVARTWIDRHFSRPTVAEILASLTAAQREAKGAEGEWAEQIVGVLHERSPLSMAVSLEVVSRAEGSMADVLRRDLDLTRSSFAQGDVVEGIRARIIDKDNHPRWHFARIEDVPPAEVEAMFRSPWSITEHPLRALSG
ncbi:enoyl-CoA hydratase/carnithine racemase [Paraburkholderia bannensis]|uniref:Enoyl-CoA hydratase/carnithine racemase n=1 Tax=Paraburkholderia bannensis TaxID=765414 RepID=A0A7W9WUH2_9BURK|nr:MULTISPECIES: enoyl-CoA hydratase/isomerase family protein [Paraburkholderia]MBB3259623.1 enoyl-CoA hydratase/carnithine racemase [Paraburkholderia sp. WP4_3_2]MBB6104639.1 enoyl-CoA hydratase/carnithine racemase [Paraburkholderia bannensis]